MAPLLCCWDDGPLPLAPWMSKEMMPCTERSENRKDNVGGGTTTYYNYDRRWMELGDDLSQLVRRVGAISAERPRENISKSPPEFRTQWKKGTTNLASLGEGWSSGLRFSLIAIHTVGQQR